MSPCLERRGIGDAEIGEMRLELGEHRATGGDAARRGGAEKGARGSGSESGRRTDQPSSRVSSAAPLKPISASATS